MPSLASGKKWQTGTSNGARKECKSRTAARLPFPGLVACELVVFTPLLASFHSMLCNVPVPGLAALSNSKQKNPVTRASAHVSG